MSDAAHFHALAHMYHGAPINDYFRPSLSIEKAGRATVEAEVREEWHHAARSLHGAVYFKMLDDAAFFAAQSHVHDYFVVTSSFNLYFIRPVVAGSLICEGRVTERTRTQILCEAVLMNNGKVAARGSGLFVPSRGLLGPDMGYLREG